MAIDEPIIDANDKKEGEEQPTNELNETKGEDKKSRRSQVWDHYTYVPGSKTITCPYCRKKMVCNPKKNGTTSLMNHLNSVCRTSLLYKKVI